MAQPALGLLHPSVLALLNCVSICGRLNATKRHRKCAGQVCALVTMKS